MKYLLPVGGICENDFGILTTPSHKNVPAGIIAGMEWAGDNEAYTRVFEPDRYFSWLENMKPYRETCLFVSVPDKVGDANATLRLFDKYYPSFAGWRVAFVAQDGQENLPFPDSDLWQVLFIGGTTDWKDGTGAAECIKRAMQLGKRIHIGRVNYWKRYNKFAQLERGYAYEFTADGTKNRFIGTRNTIKSIRIYRKMAKLQGNFLVPGRDCSR